MNWLAKRTKKTPKTAIAGLVSISACSPCFLQSAAWVAAMPAFFQAKNMRRHVLRVEVDALELQLKTDSALTENAKAAIAAKVADYKKQDEVLTKDPEKEEGKREGLDQLWEKGKALEAERDHAMQRGPYFDYGQAILQIAIVLASIALITHAFMLLAASGVLGVIGAALTFNGFTLFLHPLPFVG
jgi:hypothetical protein